MSVVRMKISAWFKQLLYIVLAGSWVTGIAFFVLNQWIRIEGEFGLEKHPMQFMVLAVHGLVAFLMLMILGAFFVNHTPIGWRSKRLRIIGATLTSLVALQVISGYLLYYISNDELRSIVMYLHLCIGFSLPLFLTAHISMGKLRKVNSKFE